MPRLGADMTAGKVVAWLKRPGEQIKRGDIIAIVETDKANVDVESFVDGVLEKILVQPGDERLPVGTPLALIRAEAGTKPAAPMPAAAAAAPAIAAVPPAPPVLGPPAAAPAILAPAAAGERARISPAARKRALELQLDATALAGSGPLGRVTLADVERAAQTAPAVRVEPGPAEAAAARQLRMREAIATSMARSKREIPHYYLACTIDMGRALAWLTERNAGRAVTERLIYAVLLIKATALALREVPELNGFWIDNRAQQSAAIHAGIAISLRGGGLVAPALHHADQRSLDELMVGFQDLVKRARLVLEKLRNDRPHRDHHQPGRARRRFSVRHHHAAATGPGRLRHAAGAAVGGERPGGAAAAADGDTFGGPPRHRRSPRCAFSRSGGSLAATAGGFMNNDEIRVRVIKTLSGIVPELDPATLKPAVSLRDQLDVDSMDFLNFLIALHSEFGVDVPEADAGKLGTIDACVEYLALALQKRAQA